MKPIPKFCIVVPVNHNIGYFRLCLESLERLDYPRDRFKVVTVDCGQVPGLAEFARHELSTFNVPLLHVTLPPGPPSEYAWMHEHRMNEARNAAVAACPAEFHIFTEDDTSFHPGWLHQTELWIDDRTGALGGPDVLPDDMDLSRRRSTSCSTPRSDHRAAANKSAARTSVRARTTS